jgi:hypothetical protein
MRYLLATGTIVVGCLTACSSSNNSPSSKSSADTANTDGGSCMILASNYDQSCTDDGDCLPIETGNVCVAAGCECVGAINLAALSQYKADIAKFGNPACNPCPSQPELCCRQGTCQLGGCSSPADILPACAGAGGTCFFGGSGGFLCNQLGPSNSCAYTDETCCVVDGGAAGH